MTIRKNVKAAIIIAVALVTLAAGSAQAQPETPSRTEVSGRVIKSLVQRLDEGFNNLDDNLNGITEERLASEAEVNRLKEEYTNEKDALARKGIGAKIILESARINQISIREVDAYEEALRTFVPILEELSATIRENQNQGFENQQKLIEHRNRFNARIHKTVNILARLGKIKDAPGIDPERVAAINKTIVMAYQVNKAYSDSSTLMNVDEIDATKSTYEMTVAQMLSVKSLLLSEMRWLKAVTIRELLDTLGYRSNNLRKQTRKLSDAPKGFMNDVFRRKHDIDALNEDPASTGSSPAASSHAEYDPVLQNIMDGTH